MNPWRRRIIAGYFATVFLAVIYVPWKEESVYYNVYKYLWLFNPPRYKAEIVYGIVVLEVIAISIVGAALLMFQDIIEPRWLSFLEWLARTKEPSPPRIQEASDPQREKNGGNAWHQLAQFLLSMRDRFRSKRS